MQTSCVAWKPVAQCCASCPRCPKWLSGSQSAQSFVLVNGFVRVIILPRSRVPRSGNPNLVQFSAHIHSPSSQLKSCMQRVACGQVIGRATAWWKAPIAICSVSVLILRLFDFLYLIGCFYWLLMIREMIEASQWPQANLLQPASLACHAPNVQQLQVIVAPQPGQLLRRELNQCLCSQLLKNTIVFDTQSVANKRFQYFVSISLISSKNIFCNFYNILWCTFRCCKE